MLPPLILAALLGAYSFASVSSTWYQIVFISSVLLSLISSFGVLPSPSNLLTGHQNTFSIQFLLFCPSNLHVFLFFFYMCSFD